MSEITALYRELDPLRPLAAEDHDLYVDWQGEIDIAGGDVKSRLVRAFSRGASPERTIVRLLTGHKGSGKTTELNRVSSRLRNGDEKRVFVSTLFAQEWLDIEDVQPEDLVLQIVRQLVADLQAVGMDLAQRRWTSFFKDMWGKAKSARLTEIEVAQAPLRFSFALKDFPTARAEFRELLRGHLPTVYDLVNRELLPHARAYLADQGYDDLLLIVDDLDKIPQKILGDRSITNHENLFLDHASTLRAIDCSLLLTVPIELAYSPAQGRLRDDYGADILTVPLVSVATRDGTPIEQGEQALIAIIGRRVIRALGSSAMAIDTAAEQLFTGHEQLLRVVRLSGGHVRGLLVMLTEMLGYVDDLPIGEAVIDSYAPRAAKDLGRALLDSDREILRHVRASGTMVDERRFFVLLRNQYIYAYEAGLDDYWYGLNPLLREVEL